MSCDLQNAYLNALCHEMIWFEVGLECGKDKGKLLIVIRALYCLKSAGAFWRSLLAELLVNIGLQSRKADLDIWICSAVHDDGPFTRDTSQKFGNPKNWQ
jgi:hypothetical protein